MAGSHKIWKLDTETGAIGTFAGTEREALIDDRLAEAAVAHTSGITTDGKRLFIVDSETSSVRSITTGPDGQVQTLVGMGLFEFGDIDGPGDEARLQHPLGIAYAEGVLYIADTYNGKIRKVNPATREVLSVAGGFEEPGGLSALGRKLYVADTNSHAIKVIDLETNAIDSLTLRGLEKLRQSGGAWSGDTIVVRQPITVKPGATEVVFDVALPEDYKVMPDSPTRILFAANDGNSRSLVNRPSGFPIVWKVNIEENTILNVMVELYYCHMRDSALCYFKESLFTINVAVSNDSENHEIRIVNNPLAME